MFPYSWKFPSNNVTGLRAGVDVLPEDAELKAKVAIAEGRVQETAAALERIVAMMSEMELDTTRIPATITDRNRSDHDRCIQFQSYR